MELSKEEFSEILEEARAELAHETRQRIKDEIKNCLRHVNSVEKQLEKIADHDAIRKHVNERITHPDLSNLSPSHPRY